MPKFFYALLSGIAVISASVAPALSADMPRMPPPPPPPPTMPPVFKDPGPVAQPSSVFPYVRLDGSLDFYRETDGSSLTDALDIEWPSLGLNVGAGLGVALTENFRVDVTGEYRAVRDIAMNCSAATVVCELSSDLDSYAVFANAYYDIGHFSGLTPYIGGGVGFASHHAKNMTLGTLSSDGDDYLDFAWNVQAGASYDLTKHASLDFNYRYTDLGELDIEPSFSGASVPININDIVAHDIRLGLRYYID